MVRIASNFQRLDCQEIDEYLRQLASNAESFDFSEPGLFFEDERVGDFRNIPVAPVEDEFFADGVDYGPNRAMKIKGKFKSDNEYLNSLFRLLRADFAWELINGVNRYVQNPESAGKSSIKVYPTATVVSPFISDRG